MVNIRSIFFWIFIFLNIQIIDTVALSYNELLIQAKRAIENNSLKDKSDLLVQSAKYDHKNIVALLLNNGEKPTLLSLAVAIKSNRPHSYAIVELLLESGFDLDNGLAVAAIAQTHGRRDVLKLLLKRVEIQGQVGSFYGKLIEGYHITSKDKLFCRS